MLKSFQKIKTLFNKKKVNHCTNNNINDIDINETKDVYYYSIDKNDFIKAKIPNHMHIIENCYTENDLTYDQTYDKYYDKNFNENFYKRSFTHDFSEIYKEHYDTEYESDSTIEYDTEYDTSYSEHYGQHYSQNYNDNYSQNLNLCKENDNISINSISEYINKYYYYDENADMFYTRNFEVSSIYSKII